MVPRGRTSGKAAGNGPAHPSLLRRLHRCVVRAWSQATYFKSFLSKKSLQLRKGPNKHGNRDIRRRVGCELRGNKDGRKCRTLKRTAKQTLENFRVYYISQGAHTITLLLSDGRHQETFHKPFSFSFTVFKITVGGGEVVEGGVEGGWLVGTVGFITICEGGADTGLFCLDIPTGRSST